jgi:DNA polymerase
MKVSCDFESRSPVDLKKHGAHVYWAHPETEALMCAYRINDCPLQVWTFDQPEPRDLCMAIEGGARIHAWNAQFEMLGFEALADRHGWPRPKIGQYVDTMAAAAAMSLPRALGDAAAALGLDVQKDKEGQRLIRKFSIPKRGGGFNDPLAPENAEDWQKFIRYCMTDVEVEEAIARRIVPLSDAEQALWTLNAKINQRGIRVDRNSARHAIVIAEKAKAQFDQQMREITGGAVRKCSEPGKLVAWVQDQGIELNSAAKSEITDLLAYDDLPDNVRKALEIRQEAAKTSVAKLQAMLDRASADGRVRGTSMYHGAGTGRFQSQGVNTSNLPRPRRIYEEQHPRPDVLFDAFRSEDPDWLTFLYGDELGRSLHLISDAIRGFIWAGPGKEFVQADYSNIEGNVIAWTANEEWKLKAIRELNVDPSLPDMYRRTAASILGLTTEEVTKKHWARQAVGKPAELGLSYGGGVMAFVTFARGYGVNLEGIAKQILEQADRERLEKARKRYEGQAKRGLSGTQILSQDAWIACEVVKLGWRAQNSAIAKSWRDLEAAVRDAVANPGTITSAAMVSYIFRNGFLWARLPSGRCLAYGAPRLKAQVWAKILLPDGTWSDSEVMDREAAQAGERKGTARIEGETSDKVTVLGVNSVTRKWERYALYSGIIAENNTQAIARDILANGMFKAESNGYEIVATVYDEILAEVPRGYGDVREFEKLICELPAWADGLPLTAGGFRAKRYKKD